MISYFLKSIKFFIYRNKEFCGFSASQLGFIPKNIELYYLALRHKSASVINDGIAMNYERLEFLGDSVLGTIISELIYKYFPNRREGFLTSIRARIVSRDSLNRISRKIELDKKIVAKNNISESKKIYGDVFEAFIGAMFLDQGYDKTKQFMENFIFRNFIDIKKIAENDINHKSKLIEWGQKNKITVVFETVLDEAISSRNKDIFSCNVFVDGNIVGVGNGKSKKEAEQFAAKAAIKSVYK